MTAPSLTPQSAPGVYLQEVIPPPAPALTTGVPAFLGYASTGAVGQAQPLALWPQFQARFGGSPAAGSWPPPCAASSRTAASCATW